MTDPQRSRFDANTDGSVPPPPTSGNDPYHRNISTREIIRDMDDTEREIAQMRATIARREQFNAKLRQLLEARRAAGIL